MHRIPSQKFKYDYCSRTSCMQYAFLLSKFTWHWDYFQKIISLDFLKYTLRYSTLFELSKCQFSFSFCGIIPSVCHPRVLQNNNNNKFSYVQSKRLVKFLLEKKNKKPQIFISRKLKKMTNLQLTLSILKPYIIRNPHAIKIIHNAIAENNIEIVRHTNMKLTKALAAKFYEEHVGKFFFNRLQTFMCR